MIEWDEKHLEELVRKMGLRRAPGQGKTPIHLSLYGPSPRSAPLLTQVMLLDANEWAALGYDETDRVSVTRYLGSLGCRTDGALSTAARWQRPLTLELAKALIDAGALDKDALSHVACWQSPLSLKLAKLLIDAGCDPAVRDDDGWDALVWLAHHANHPVDPQVTDLFLAAGCRTDLDGCGSISCKHRLCFNQILEKHAQWKLTREYVQTDASFDLDWTQWKRVGRRRR